jgi:uncharacterized protein YPO0396
MELRFDYATDDTLAGFRLSQFEMYNWGTYDKNIVVLKLDKHNGLLTGDIGSGKSTIVDALTTLIVPHQKIVYNKAAGAEGRERTLYSYIVGEYKSQKDDAFGSAKAIALRDEKSYSVLLARFENEGFDETFTLAQFFYLSGQQVNKFFITSHGSLNIKEHFLNFSDIKELKKRLKQLPHTDVHESFSDYAKQFRRTMGIKNEQALNLFYQTVSLKAIGNLTDFIRQHMLEPSDIDTKINELCQNFSELSHVHDQVLRAKKQIELLIPIDEEGYKYESDIAKKSDLEEKQEHISGYFASHKVVLLQQILSNYENELTKLESEEKVENQIIEALRQKDKALTLEIQSHGGNRLNEIQRERRWQEEQREEKKKPFDNYNGLAKALEFPILSDLENNYFFENQRKAKKQLSDVSHQDDLIEQQLIADGVSLSKEKEKLGEIESERIYLENNRSNIPQRVSHIRDEMAKVLDIDIAKLPFIGELVQVEDEKWQGAIERVMHNTALSLLVREEYYSRVSEYVEQTHLRGKLVYLKVEQPKNTVPYEYVEKSLLQKISIKPDSPFFKIVQKLLHERFDIPCVEDMEQFRRNKTALSINGQFKGSYSRHEKDDRYEINDKSRWTLGWDNGQKLITIIEQCTALQEKIAFLSKRQNESKSKREQLTVMRSNLENFLRFETYSELDWFTHAKKIDELEVEKRALESSSDILATLQKELTKVQEEEKKKTSFIQKLNENIGKHKTKIENSKDELDEVHLNIIEGFDYAKMDSLMIDYGVQIGTLYLSALKNDEKSVHTKISTELQNINNRLDTTKSKLIKFMNQFCNEFPVLTKELDVDIATLSEYRKKLTQLKKDDLPKFEKKLKELFKEKTIQNIVIVQTSLEQQRDAVKKKIATINQSLHDIEYNQGTFIELIAEIANNAEIKAFNQELKLAVSGAIGDDNSYDEDKFLRIKQIIARFNGREGHADVDKKWRKLVTDVRNWFDFSAIERYESDGSEKEFYAHSGGKSGGQKEKLAYTVLASSLAYQFGLEYNAIQSRSFRFVMIDEAFGRGSDESTRYALTLFEKLHLQLLVITPKQKINVIEPFVKSVHYVHNQDGMKSSIISLSIDEYQKNKEAS